MPRRRSRSDPNWISPQERRLKEAKAYDIKDPTQENVSRISANTTWVNYKGEVIEPVDLITW